MGYKHTDVDFYCEPPKRTLSEAKSARRGRAYRSREDLYSDKFAIWEKKYVRSLAETASLLLLA